MGNPLTNEIRDSLAILKARWPEAAVIIGLGSLPKLLSHMVRIYHDLAMVVSLVSVGMVLLITIISAGFLRTVYLEQDKRQTVVDLMRIGKYFFLATFCIRYIIWIGCDTFCLVI